MANPLAIAAALYGGYRGYRQAKDSGASGLGRLFGAGLGAFGGYQLGSAVGPMVGISANPATVAALNTGAIAGNPAIAAKMGVAPLAAGNAGALAAQGSLMGSGMVQSQLASEAAKQAVQQEATKKFGLEQLKNTLLYKQGDPTAGYDMLKISALAGGVPYALGAFDQGPVDVYQPTYNLAYADLAAQRPGYSYIDPTTGQEKAYEKVYIPEADPANQGDRRVGPYAMEKTRLRSGGLAEIRKFNEGGINYLPSKVEHNEDDANNYVRASGYVEDGSGAGDKDEDTMLAQLADGEFVTRADGVLGAGIIAGGNPSSIKDMREKGAKYFYEQQARYKRVFDLLKEKDGISKQKTN